MRFLHLGDLHLGKSLGDFDLIGPAAEKLPLAAALSSTLRRNYSDSAPI